MRGVDVAKWNTVNNYAALKTGGIDFSIVKVINKSNQPDGGFERHLEGFAGAGIPVIAGYNYLYTTTESAAVKAAEACVKTAAGRIPMIYADVEDPVLRTVSKEKLASILKEYQKVVEDAGLEFGIYCSLDWYRNVLDVGKVDAPFWIARYGKNNGSLDLSYKPVIAHQMNGWQFTSRGRYPGITGDVDLNEWYAESEGAAAVVPETGYSTERFVQDMATALGIPGADAMAVLQKTVTISTKKNRKHACVTPLERLLKEKGLYHGNIEADLQKEPVFGNGMAKATAMFQSMNVGMRHPDSIWTKRAASYKTALGLRKV